MNTIGVGKRRRESREMDEVVRSEEGRSSFDLERFLFGLSSKSQNEEEGREVR